MRQAAAQAIAPAAKILEQLRDLRMVDRFAILVHQQVLLADIGDVGTVIILGQQMIEWLIAPWPLPFGDLFIPFVRIGIDRIDIKHDAAKIMAAVLYDITNRKASARTARGIDETACL